MAPSTTKTKEVSVITPHQKFEGHTELVWGVIHPPGGQRVITCSLDGSLRVWDLRSGKQIGADWRDGEKETNSIALSPDGKKVVSGSSDGVVRLWDTDTGKVIVKWTGHTKDVSSVSWSRDGRCVLSGSWDGTARQWDVESGDTILKPIETGHNQVWAVVYSPDMTLIATGGWEEPLVGKPEYSVKICNTKTGKLVATLKGHTNAVTCLAWTKDGKALISGSWDNSIRTWNTTKWEQTAVLLEHIYAVYALAISPNGCILASASRDHTARLWNLDNGQPISLPLQHAEEVNCVSFSADGKRLATGCDDKNAYMWDIAEVIREAGLDDLLSNPKANKSALRSDAARHLAQRRSPAYRTPQRFFDGVPPDGSRFPAQSHSPSSSELQESTLLRRLFHRSPSNAHDMSPSSPLNWARNFLDRRRQSGEDIKLQGHSPAVVEVPYTKGKRRNVSAREVALAKQKQKHRTKPLRSKNSTAGSSQTPKPTVAESPSQPHAARSSSTTPAVGDPTIATTSTPSRPDATIRQAGLWTRLWLFIGCLSPEYTDDHP